MSEGRLTGKDVKQAFAASLPIILGYIVLGIPCGVLCQKAGMDFWMVVAMSVLFYSGAGQYMIPNMWLAGVPLPSLITSVILINTRQLLYGSALSPFCNKVSKGKAVAMAGGVTDESFGVNLAKFQSGDWKVSQAGLVNGFSQSSWAIANMAGFIIGGVFSFDTAIASFAMTSIFLCLLMMQRKRADHFIAGACAAIGVIACKMIGLAGPAILIGALIGVAAGLIAGRRYKDEDTETEEAADALV